MHLPLLLILALLGYKTESISTCDSSLCVCIGNSCTSCLSSHFFPNTLTNQCELCNNNCGTCQSKEKCTTCANGYYMSSENCLQCPPFCSICSNGTFCNTCIDGYVSVNGVCQICAIPNVQICQSQMTVFSCFPGFWKNGDSCSPCRQFCQSCTSSTNCLACSQGYRVQVSAGTYCTPCPSGCKTCAPTCTSCLPNYRLISGICTEIAVQCQSVTNCRECEYVSNSIRCKICSYPYYLSSAGTCVKGSSLLCRNGAIGMNRYDCIGSCGGVATAVDVLGVRTVCGVGLWVPKSDVKLVFLEASNNWAQFAGARLPYVACSKIPVVYSDSFVLASNKVSLSYVFPPYYKLVFQVKSLPLYKQTSQNSSISLSIVLRDNSTTSQNYTQQIDTSNNIACEPFYFTVQSKIIKDQNVTIDFQAALLSDAGIGIDSFAVGLVGYSEILVQIYRCSQDCRICANAKYCIECYGSFFVYQNQCVNQCYGLFQFYAPVGNPYNYTYKSCLQHCPLGFYSTLHPLKSNTYICAACEYPCSSCKSQLECLSCKSPYLYYELGFSCVLTCPNTHYNRSDGICVPCNSPCKNCLDAVKCLTCSIGYYFQPNASCFSNCPDGYYANSTSRVCEKCDRKCTKCTATSTNCMSCASSYYLFNGACLQQCPNQTHYPFNSVCQPCKPPCFYCTAQFICTTCITGYLFNSTCNTLCPDGYFGNFTSNICQKCEDSYCLRCGTAGLCESCTGNRVLYNGKCLMQCPARMYPSGGDMSGNNLVCVTCIQPCFQCSNSTFCLTCQMGYMSIVHPGKCISSCQTGYFESQISNMASSLSIIRSCLPCSSSCLTCKQNSTCLTCKDNSLVLSSNGLCIRACPDGYFNRTRICELCSYPCNKCDKKAQNCTSCHLPYVLSGFSCISQCSITEFQKNNQCFACLAPCRTCSDSNICLSCILDSDSSNQTFLYNVSCVKECPSSTYADILTLKCRSCNYPCQTCTDSKKCLTCASGYLNPDKLTCQNCPQTSFPNEQTRQCQPCSSTIANCYICSSSSTCRYCSPNFYLLNGNCIDEFQCKNTAKHYPNQQQMICSTCVPPCGECTAESICKTCVSGYLFGTRCLLECPPKYYVNALSGNCMPCDSTICLTCSLDPNTCLTCNTSSSRPIYMPSESTCIATSQCIQQFYIDYSFGYGRCIKCQAPCLTCSSARSCLSCITGILYNNECKSSCPVSFFEIIETNSSTPKCLQCSLNCLQCRNSASICISCSNDKYLQNSTCVTNCSDGYFLDSSTLVCKPCVQPCQTCSSASTCISCMNRDTNGNILNNTIVYYGQCLQLCPDSTYEINRICVKCPNYCQICASKLNSSNQIEVYCKKCAQNLFMNSSSPGKCQSKCSLPEYPDSYTRSCYQCQSPCVTCLTATACLTCESNYIIYQNDCIRGTVCPIKTFKSFDPVANIDRCVDKCSYPYFGSQFTRECILQCPYNYVKYIPSSMCLSECPTNYYLSQNLMCQECQQSICNSLLKMQIKAKSIFNTLYIRINFNQEVSMIPFKNVQNKSSSDILVQYRQLSSLYEGRRLLQSFGAIQALPHEIAPIKSSNTVWLKIMAESSLNLIQLQVSFSNHYLLPSKILQNTNSTTLLQSFDKFGSSDIEAGQNIQRYSIAISITMCLLFFANIIFNTGYLMYPMTDYFQLIFLLLFLNVDYPPLLNHFMYGFRYSHYLFLPQIFNTAKIASLAQNTPEKFGIIVPDANFLNNTGHDFLIMFIVVGIFSVVKMIDFLSSCMVKKDSRSNKIHNQQQNEQKMSKSDTKSEKQQTGSQFENSEASLPASQANLEKANTMGKKAKLILKIILNRIRWNYFNDFLFIMYFYLMLFAFCQLYDLIPREGTHYVSSVFAVVFVVLGIGWPIGLTAMLYIKNKSNKVFKQVSESCNQAYYIEYKCFVSQVKPLKTNMFGLLQCPIRYYKKLLYSILFAYCSEYENFIIGIVAMFNILTIVTNVVYRPFKNKIQFISHSLFQALFCLGCLSLCVFMAKSIGLSQSTKIGVAAFTVAIWTLLSILLALYNCAVIALNIFEYMTGKNLLEKYNQSDTQNSEKRSEQKQRTEQNSNSVDQQSNLRLNITLSKNRKNSNEYLMEKNRKQCESNADQSESSAGLDIYLKQDGMKTKTPQVLIKCIKGSKFEQSQDNSDEEPKFKNKKEQSDLEQQQEQNQKTELSQRQKNRAKAVESEQQYAEQSQRVDQSKQIEKRDQIKEQQILSSMNEDIDECDEQERSKYQQPKQVSENNGRVFEKVESKLEITNNVPTKKGLANKGEAQSEQVKQMSLKMMEGPRKVEGLDTSNVIEVSDNESEIKQAKQEKTHTRRGSQKGMEQ